MLQRMYLRWAEKRGLRPKYWTNPAAKKVGIKNVTISIAGSYAFGYLKSEHGVHAWSAFRRLIPTMPVILRLYWSKSCRKPKKRRRKDCARRYQVDTFRSSGAGGQNVQKVQQRRPHHPYPDGYCRDLPDERSSCKTRHSR